MQPLLAPQTTEFVICISIYIWRHAVISLPPERSLVLTLALGITWVRQLRSGSCHYPSAATECNASVQANKPRRRKSMLIDQGWFILLIYATFTGTTNYRVCNLHIYLYMAPRTHTSKDARLDKKGLKCNLPNFHILLVILSCFNLTSCFSILLF